MSKTSNGSNGNAGTTQPDSTETTTENSALESATHITGTPGDDLLQGTDGDDHIAGASGDDRIIGGEGDDKIAGASGFDTAVFSGDVRDYEINLRGNLRAKNLDVVGADGNDHLTNVEALEFDNATIYLDGRNNGPVVDDQAASLIEDGSAVTLNVLANAYDFEGDTISLASVDASGFDGTVTFDSVTGEVTFDIGTAYQYLAVGETLEVTLTYVATDGTDIAERTITLTITGTNDVPVVTAIDAGSTDEDAALFAIDLLSTATDVDASDDLDVDSVSAASSNGARSVAFTVDAETGAFALDPSQFNDLALGEAETVTVSYNVNDGNGGVVANTATFIVEGRNDVPVVTAIDAGTTDEDAAPFAIDLLSTATDVDASDDLDVDSVTAASSNAARSVSFTVDAETGAFELDPSQFNDLAVGESETVTVSYNVNDGNGGVVANTATFVVEGRNDGPTANDDTLGGSGVGASVDWLSGATSTIGAIGEPNTAYYGQTFVADGGVLNEVSFGMSAIYYSDDIEFRVLIVEVNQAGSPGSYNIDPEAVLFESGALSLAHGTSDTITVSTAGLSLTEGQTYAVIIDAFSEFDGVNGAGQVAFDFNNGGDPNGQFFYLNVNGGDRATHFGQNWSEWSGGDMALALEYGAPGLTDEDTAHTITAADLLGNDTDPDANDVLSISEVSATSSLGATVTLNADGSVNYDPTSSAALDALAEGETLDDSFTYTVSDGNGGFDTATVTLTVAGRNDAPVVTAIDAGSTNEDAAPFAIDLLSTATDVDTSDDLDVDSVTAASSNGARSVAFTVDAETGAFALDPSQFNDLAVGEAETITVSYNVNDGNGGVVANTATFVVEGRNDGPVLVSASSTGSVTELADGDANENAITHSASGQIAFDDVDLSDTHAASVTPVGGGYLGSLTLGAIDQGGDTVGWTFEVADSVLDGLSAGEVLTQDYLIAVADGNGGSVSENVTITLTGSNDAPTAGSVTLLANALGNGGFDDGFAGWNTSTATSNLTWTHYSNATVGTSAYLPNDDSVAILNFAGQVPTPYGTGYGPTITSDVFSGQAGDTVRFTYNLSSGGDHALGVGYIKDANTGAIVQEIFNYNTGFTGSTGEQTVDLTLASSGEYVIEFRVGSYDATGGYYVGARMDIGFAGILRDGVSEDQPFTFSGVANDILATASDVDGDSLTVTIDGTTSALGATVTLNADGSMTYESNGALDYLTAGEEVTDTITFIVDDGNGGTTTATAEVKVIGENDGPVAGDDAAQTGEDSAVTISALANDTDADGEALTIQGFDAVSASGASISLDANGDFVYDPSGAAALQSLLPGQQVIDTFTYTVVDPQGATSTATVSVTVDGSLEAPVANADSVTVAQGGTASGNLVTNDEVTGGTGATGNVLVNASFEDGHNVGPGGIGYVASLPGWSAVNGIEIWGTGFLGNTAADGIAFLELDNGAGTQDAYSQTLTTEAGREYTLEFDLAMRSGTWAATNQVEFLVNGVSLGVFTPNTTAFTTFSATFIGTGSDEITFREPAGANDGLGGLIDNLRISAEADVFVTGVDGDAASVGQSVTGSNGGSFIVQADGSYAFDAGSDFDYLIAGETLTTEISYTVTDAGGSSTSTLTVTVEGTDDAPVVSGVSTGTAIEATIPTVSGTLSIVDPDAGQSSFQTNASIAGAFGVLSIDAAGNWSYALDGANATVIALATGEFLTDTVTVLTADGTAQEITLTIEGRDLVPTVSAPGTSGIGDAFLLTGFAKGIDPDIANSETQKSLSVSVVSDGGKDWYKIDVPENGTTVTFDIDYGMNSGGSFDPWLNLRDANGNLISSADDASTSAGDGGSAHPYDSFLQATLSAGTYYIEVAAYPNTNMPAGSTYELQVSMALPSGDPIVLDLNGDGFAFMGDAVDFDLNNDGSAERLGWSNPEDGLLVVDLNGSGAIETGNEVISEYFNGAGYADSVAALASLDTNRDGVVDASDAGFADLLVWQDTDSDGVSDAGELHTLAELGIASISVDAQAVDYELDGQDIFAEGAFAYASGETGQYVGIGFAEEREIGATSAEGSAKSPGTLDTTDPDHTPGHLDAIQAHKTQGEQNSTGPDHAPGQLDAIQSNSHPLVDYISGLLGDDSVAEFLAALDEFGFVERGFNLDISDQSTPTDIDIIHADLSSRGEAPETFEPFDLGNLDLADFVVIGEDGMHRLLDDHGV